MIKKLFPESISKRKPPINISKNDITLFDHEYLKTINATELIELKNIYILNNTIFNPITLRFYNKYCLVNPTRKKQLIKNLLLLTKKKVTIKYAAWIIDENAYGYFHWLTDCLCRLLAIENNIKEHVVLLPHNLKKHHFIEQTLKYFNINPFFMIHHYL